jgi:hypothetical protein
MDEMTTAESMARRATKNGDEQDYDTSAHRYYHCYHGVRGKVATIRRRRDRRGTRQALRNYRDEV